jgi:hypothetical protein
MGLDGILYFMPVADVLTAVVSVIVIINTVKSLNAEQSGDEKTAEIIVAAGR